MKHQKKKAELLLGKDSTQPIRVSQNYVTNRLGQIESTEFKVFQR
jgi:hypothetical protein